MYVFVLNCGSSSLKYQLLDMRDERRVASGMVERIGMEGSVFVYESSEGEKIRESHDVPTHDQAIRMVLNHLTDPEKGVIRALSDITAVGHRIVHGGERFSSSVLIDDEVIAALKDCIPLAPLHNPANITGIEAIMGVMLGVPNIAVFDTAFHSTMPPESYMYALPYEWYEKYHVRRYGFHGSSHRFVSERAAQMLGIPKDMFNCVSCHMGNGSSFTAIRNGDSIDTSMGLTPLEGLVMGSRCGDLDAGIPDYLASCVDMSFTDIHEALNTRSGLLGLSGISSDMRDLEKAISEGDARAQLAVDVLHHSALKYIGAYTLELGRVDAIIFTGGIGENATRFRGSIVDSLELLDVRLDPVANAVYGQETVISTDDSKIKVVVVPTNEELMIARDTLSIASLLTDARHSHGYAETYRIHKRPGGGKAPEKT
ncbi:MAG: acetate kinase [Candidatus Accumulibacter sp.]|jgi:acetate kinase|nr:acetate kinase [Accumulibacter sp.]